MLLELVRDYIGQSRVLLQDTVQPYRYDDEGLVTALNNGWLEVSKLRPDILLDYKYRERSKRTQLVASLTSTVPTYTTSNEAQQVYMPTAYRMALLYYICGFAQLRDVEDAQDARASMFGQMFTKQMMGLG